MFPKTLELGNLCTQIKYELNMYMYIAGQNSS